MDPSVFNEGDEVLLDGELAMIVKIGVRQTVFGVYSRQRIHLEICTKMKE